MCAGQRGEDVDEVAPLVRRQAGGRLVEQDEARRTGERQRDLELALLAVAELGDQRVGAIRRGGPRDMIRLAWSSVASSRRGRTKREAPARHAAAGEEDRVDARERPPKSCEIW